MELNKTFIDGLWSKEINVSDFVSTNIAPYTGDASFLKGFVQFHNKKFTVKLFRVQSYA